MADQHDRGLFHHHGHKKPEGEEVIVESTDIHTSATSVGGVPVDYKTEIKSHARKEHLAEAGTVLSGAFAMYEKHQAKKDPENAHKHHIGEAIAGAAAIGSGAFAVHEHHDKKEAEKEGKHHHFGHDQ